MNLKLSKQGKRSSSVKDRLQRTFKGDPQAGFDLLIVTYAAGAVVAVDSMHRHLNQTVVVAVVQPRRPSFAVDRHGAATMASIDLQSLVYISLFDMFMCTC